MKSQYTQKDFFNFKSRKYMKQYCNPYKSLQISLHPRSLARRRCMMWRKKTKNQRCPHLLSLKRKKRVWRW